MRDFLFPLKLGDTFNIDKEKQKDEIIQGRKKINQIMKDGKNQAKLDKCYYCGTDCESFCNSHTLPAFCLRNIAHNGKVFYSNSILDLPILNTDKGINEAGTFHLICRECDSKIFQDYENPDNYKNIPSVKMLAQIDMKNNLKNISKRLVEKETYSLMQERLGVGERWVQTASATANVDLQEFKDAYSRARSHSKNPFEGDYYIGFYRKLPYVVPIAFQGTIALIFDLAGNIINSVYESSSKYKIKNMSLCIFPLKEESIIMIFVERNNDRYKQFFKQLRKLDCFEDQLSVINYILFSYTEDYFLSPNIPKNTLDELLPLSGKTPELISLTPPNLHEVFEVEKEIFNLGERCSVPNLLLSQFGIRSRWGSEELLQ